MPEFLIFAVAAAMCVLCFSVGFIAALVLRIAGNTAVPVRDGAGAAETPTAEVSAAPQPAPAEVPSVPVTQERAPTLPQAPAAVEQHPAAVVPAPAPLPLRTATRTARPAGVPAGSAAAPGAKVFLFAEQRAETVVPAFTPAFGGPHPNPPTPGPHGAQVRFAPVEIDLLPHRPHHARSGRAR